MFGSPTEEFNAQSEVARMAKLVAQYKPDVGLVECDRQNVRPVTYQVVPPLSKRFLLALQPMET